MSIRATTERHVPGETGQEVIGLYARYAYSVAASMASGRVLDIGFGEGHGSSFFSQYVGVEIDPACVAHARKKYGRDFRLYDGVVLPREVFDLIVCFQVIEHVADPDPLVAEIARCGCTALFTTPNREVRLDGDKPWNRHHVREFAPVELSELLSRHFSSVRVFGIHAPPEIERMELARIARAKRLARLDVVGLRYWLPEVVNARLRRSLRAGVVRDVPDDLGGFSHSEEPSLDLLAVCDPQGGARADPRVASGRSPPSHGDTHGSTRG